MDSREHGDGGAPAGETRPPDQRRIVGGNWLIPVGLVLGALLLALATGLATTQLRPEASSLRDAPPPAPRS